MSEILAIDIGGTNVKAGVFSNTGELFGKAVTPTSSLADGAPDEFLKALHALVEGVGGAPEDIAAVGLDVPGPVIDREQVGTLPNASLDVLTLRRAIERAFPNAPTTMANDACAAAAGELWKGAGAEGAKDFMLVALGTGVGAGLVVNEAVVEGAFGAAGELGHMCVDRTETEPCGCGKRGCLEQYASATGIVRSYLAECTRAGAAAAQLAGPTDTLAVFAAACAGDAAANAAISLMCEHLGFALAQAALVADPGLFLVGGGVGAGFAQFAGELRGAFRKHALPHLAATRIEQAHLGNDAALYGCAYLAMQA